MEIATLDKKRTDIKKDITLLEKTPNKITKF